MLVFLTTQKKSYLRKTCFLPKSTDFKTNFWAIKKSKKKSISVILCIFLSSFWKQNKKNFFWKIVAAEAILAPKWYIFTKKNYKKRSKKKNKFFFLKPSKNASKWLLQVFEKSLKIFFIMSWTSAHTPVTSNFDELLLTNYKTLENLVTMKIPLFGWIIE